MLLLMMLAGCVLAVCALVAKHWIRRHGLLVLAARFFSGQDMDGQYRTNATWCARRRRSCIRPGTPPAGITGPGGAVPVSVPARPSPPRRSCMA